MVMVRYISNPRAAVAGLALSVLAGCSAIPNAERISAVEEMYGRITSLPLELEAVTELPKNNCSLNLTEMVCRLYIEEKIDDGVTQEYYGIVQKSANRRRLVLAFFDGDGYDMNNKKIMSVVIYEGNGLDIFTEEEYANRDHKFDDFIKYYGSPETERLDTSNNQLKNAILKNLITLGKLFKYREEMNDRIKYALELLIKQRKLEANK